jgi:hypothetical protein
VATRKWLRYILGLNYTPLTWLYWSLDSLILFAWLLWKIVVAVCPVSNATET